MASYRAAKPPTSRSVFINCPFDDEFKPLLRAMVFTIIVSGYRPFCALDATDGAETRVVKIAAMIGACDWGIHDLSRVEIAPAGLPRFNMPMELGIHLGARLLGEGRHRRKRALILDTEAHRYDKSISDISGQDIESHKNDPNEIIRCVRNWLSEHRPGRAPPLPGIAALREDYRTFQADVDQLLAAKRLDPLKDLTHSDYVFAISDWLEAIAAN